MDGHLNTRTFVDSASSTPSLSASRVCYLIIRSACVTQFIRFEFRIAINTSDSFECFYAQSNYTFKPKLVFIPPLTSSAINTRKCYRTFLPFDCVFSPPAFASLSHRSGEFHVWRNDLKEFNFFFFRAHLRVTRRYVIIITK